MEENAQVNKTNMTQIIHISFAKLDYTCPYCQKEYYDKNDALCERLNKSKSGYLRLKCEGCKKKFGYTVVDMTGQPQTFELLNNKQKK